MKKQHLIVLSDIQGKTDDDWIQNYTEELEAYFDIQYLDSCELAEIDINGKSTEEIHTEFVNVGIDKAANNLKEVKAKNTSILAFSIGGTIAWKAVLNEMSVVRIIAISSTRLRKEFRKPNCHLDLFYGANDLNRPMDEWFEAMEIAPEIVFGKDHEMYKEKSIAQKVIRELIPSDDW